MATPKTIHVRGEGGGIHTMDLPLPEAIAERMAKGLIVRVNEDGSPYTAPAKPAKAPAPAAPAEADKPADTGNDQTGDKGSGGEDDDVPTPPTKAPAKTASKADWAAWAIASGATADDAEAMTKNDLIDRYGN